MSLLATRSLAVSIAGIRVCRGLDLDINAAGRWAILGRNGIGKTTLLKTLAGLHAPDAGVVVFGGVPQALVPRRERAQRLGVLFQEQDSLFPGSVLETVLIGRHPWLERWDWEGPNDIRIARAALAAVGLDGFERRTLTTLSGGERQRLGIATLLAQDPALCLLDEPTNHLDPYHQIQIMELLCRTAAQDGPRAVVMVLHDVNLAARYCDHALLLYGDGAVEHGPTRVVLNAGNLERLYGHPVLAVATDFGEFYYPA
jgi:iron complex transport system ATP-binding protein